MNNIIYPLTYTPSSTHFMLSNDGIVQELSTNEIKYTFKEAEFTMRKLQNQFLETICKKAAHTEDSHAIQNQYYVSSYIFKNFPTSEDLQRQATACLEVDPQNLQNMQQSTEEIETAPNSLFSRGIEILTAPFNYLMSLLPHSNESYEIFLPSVPPTLYSNLTDKTNQPLDFPNTTEAFLPSSHTQSSYNSTENVCLSSYKPRISILLTIPDTTSSEFTETSTSRFPVDTLRNEIGNSFRKKNPILNATSSSSYFTSFGALAGIAIATYTIYKVYHKCIAIAKEQNSKQKKFIHA